MIISVLIPAYNEAERIANTIRAVKSLPYPLEIIIVDDGSTDSTAEKAKSAGADFVYRQQNGGKGKALNKALELAKGEILLLLDADLGASASEAEKLLLPLLEDKADMTIALFPRDPNVKAGGAGFVVRRAREGIFRLTGRTMLAPLSGQRAIKREVVIACGGFAEGWGVEVEIGRAHV